jgi:hypothetical protein
LILYLLTSNYFVVVAIVVEVETSLFLKKTVLNYLSLDRKLGSFLKNLPALRHLLRTDHLVTILTIPRVGGFNLKNNLLSLRGNTYLHHHVIWQFNFQRYLPVIVQVPIYVYRYL